MVAAYKTSYPLHLSSVGDVVEVIRYNSEKYKDALFDIGVLPGSFIGIIKKNSDELRVTMGQGEISIPNKLTRFVYVTLCRFDFAKNCSACNACQKSNCKKE